MTDNSLLRKHGLHFGYLSMICSSFILVYFILIILIDVKYGSTGNVLGGSMEL